MQLAQICIEGKRLAIFASRMGYAGKVIQDYAPFDDEESAIAKAKKNLQSLMIPFEDEICRPRIDRMTITIKKEKK